ncbi:MAG: diphthine--ammonia ligase [Thermoguttaceae bacterium]
MEKAIVSWSTGKDSALVLHSTLNDPEYKTIALLTTVSASSNRVSMHGVHRALLEQQAASIGLPLKIVSFTPNEGTEIYETSLQEVLLEYRHKGVKTVVIGDIFLDNLRKEREAKLAKIGMKAVFPLWKRNTRDLACAFINLGFKAITTSIDTTALGKEFLGRMIDEEFLARLPASVDPCGENGEFHTFVFDGPIFARPVSFTIGEQYIFDDRYLNCDLTI